MWVMTHRESWPDDPAPVVEPLLWALCDAPGDVHVTLHASDGSRSEVLCGVFHAGTADSTVVVDVPAHREVQDVPLLVQVVGVLESGGRGAPKGQRPLEAAVEQLRREGLALEPERPGAWRDDRSGLLVGDGNVVLPAPCGPEVAEQGPEEPQFVERDMGGTDWGRFFTHPVYAAPPPEGSARRRLDDRLIHKVSPHFRAGFVERLETALQEEGVTREVVDRAEAAGDLTSGDREVLERLVMTGFVVLRSAGGLDPEGVQLLHRAVVVLGRGDPQDEFLRQAGVDLARLREAQQAAREGVDLRPPRPAASNAGPGWPVAPRYVTPPVVEDPGPHPTFSRWFGSPLAFADGLYDQEAPPETWSLVMGWAGRLISGERFTLRDVLTLEGAEPESLDALAAGEASGDDGDLLADVIDTGYLLLYCTGSVDDEGLQLLERAVQVLALADPDDAVFGVVLKEIGAYRQARANGDVGAGERGPVPAPGGPSGSAGVPSCDEDEDEDEEVEDQGPHPVFAEHFRTPVCFGGGIHDPGLSDEAWDLADEWAGRLWSGEQVTLRGLLEEDGLEPQWLDRLLAGDLEEDDDTDDLVLAAGYLLLYCTGALDEEGVRLVEAALDRACRSRPGERLYLEAREEFRTYRQAVGV